MATTATAISNRSQWPAAERPQRQRSPRNGRPRERPRRTRRALHEPSPALDALLLRYRPERLVLCDASADEQELLALVHRCKELSLKVSLLPQLFSAMGPSVEVDDVEGVTVLGINPPVLPRTSRYLKRALDLLVSARCLLLAAP